MKIFIFIYYKNSIIYFSKIILSKIEYLFIILYYYQEEIFTTRKIDIQIKLN